MKIDTLNALFYRLNTFSMAELYKNDTLLKTKYL